MKKHDKKEKKDVKPDIKKAEKLISNFIESPFTADEMGQDLLNFARAYGGAEVALMEGYRQELEELKRTMEEISALQAKVDEQFALARVRGQLKGES